MAFDHRVFHHQQNLRPLALVRFGLRRRVRAGNYHSVGDNDDGDDDHHRRFSRCDRVAEKFFARRLHLRHRPDGDGFRQRQMARARRWVVSIGHWRSVGRADPCRRDASVFHHRPTFDLVFDALHDDESRFFDGGIHFRLDPARPRRTRPFRSIRNTHQHLPDVVSCQSGFRNCSDPGGLLFAQRRRSHRRRRAHQSGKAKISRTPVC